jgi:hypothetical protein
VRNDNRVSIAFFLVGVIAPLALADEPIILGDPPTETPAHKAGLITLPDGSVEVYYLRDGKNGKEIASRRTTDNGHSWSEPKSIFELPGGHVAPMTTGDWIIVRPLLTKNKELHFFILRCSKMGARSGFDQFISTWYVGSRDGRSRWHGPKLLFEGCVGPPRCAIELPSGRILYPFDHAFGDRDTNYPTGLGEVMCAYSDDGGDSWQFSPSKLTTPVDRVYRAPNYGALEPVIMELSDGRLWMLLRTQAGQLYESYSRDDGLHWTPAAPTRFRSSNSPAELLRLSGGRIVLFWNNCQNPPSIDGSEPYTNRDVVHAALSLDEGKTWGGYREIYRAPRRNLSPPKEGTTTGTSYPEAAATNGNKIFVMTGHGPQSAKALLVDPDWLLETAASEHFENGLEQWSVYKGIGPIETSWRERIAGASLESHPDKKEMKVLHIRRPKGEPADGAVWNFPKGKKGTLRLKIRLRPGFAGASIALADCFYDPTDVSGERQALFDLRVSNFRQLLSGPALDSDRWYELEMKWDVAKKICTAAIDGKQAVDLAQLNPSTEGPNYLRLRSLAQATDEGGFLIESVEVKIDNGKSVSDAPSLAVPSEAVRAHPPRVVSSFHAEQSARYPFPQNMYRALHLPDGPIIAFSIARDEKTRQQTMQGRYSTDNGGTWSDPKDLFQFPRKAGGFGLFEALVDQQGEIQIATLCDGNSGILFPKEEGTGTPAYDILEIWHASSKSKATSWNAPQRIREGKGGDLLSFIQLRNGRLVLPICFATGRTIYKRGGAFLDFTYSGDESCTSMYSDDNGNTWHESPDVLSVETPDLHTYGCDEPVAIQLKDGRVWMLMRTQKGRFYESFSNDGARWSPPHPTRLISSDSPAALIRLRDDSLVLFSNACLRYPYAYGGRYVLHGAVSRDDGRTWHGFREIARDVHRNERPTFQEDYGVAYSFPTQTTDGHILFSNWVEQGDTRRFRLFDPAWLAQTQQQCNFSDDLDDWSIFGSKGVEIQRDPDQKNMKVLSLRKADPQWPAGAVWNFPMGHQGRLRLRFMLRSGFGGANLGLTDHFSPPWDLEDEFHSVFNLPISKSGVLLPGVKLAAGQWHTMELDWDIKGRKCEVFLNDQQVGAIDDNRRSDGVNYLRLRSVAEKPDEGLLISSVSVDVSGSWPHQD